MTLEPTSLTYAFCKHIPYSGSVNFHSFSPILVTVDLKWPGNASHTHKGAAAYVASKNTTGFTGCVVVAGRIYSAVLLGHPHLQYTIYQINVYFRTKHMVEGGMVRVPTWGSGSRCVKSKIRVSCSWLLKTVVLLEELMIYN